MNDNVRCFVLTPGGYEEISYAELQERRANNSAYADKWFIPLHGMLMEVTEVDYRDFYRNIRRQKYLAEEAERNGAFSYNALDTDEMSGEDIITDTSTSIDDVVSDKLLIEEMLLCFGKLDEAERKLLAALYFDGKSERGLSQATGVPQKTINDRKRRAVAKLKKLLGF